MKKEPEYQCVASDNGVELWVEFTYDVQKHTEEFHGQHSNDEYDIDIKGIDLVIGGKFISVKKSISEDARASLIKLLEI
jgi:hypothetical protein